jgi:ATP-dependent protease HslVU (ClpYQ) peptidase subunit
MTTIATDGKVIASDSRITCGSIIATDKDEKIFKGKKGSIIGCAGSRADIEKFRCWCLEGKSKNEIPELENFSAIELTSSGKVYGYGDSCYRIKVEAPHAIGTGGDIALGAMLSGIAPKEAVQIAIKKDVWSGGKVVVKAPRHNC